MSQPRTARLRWRLLATATTLLVSLALGELALRWMHGPADLYGCYRAMRETQLTEISWPQFARRQQAMRQACERQTKERARDHEILSFCYNPGFQLEIDDWRLSINSHALRGEEIPLARPAGEIRVMCLGGSTTAGEEVSDEETYPAQLQMLLRQKFPHRTIRVINAGVPSYDVRQSWLDYSLRLWRFQPHVVTIYHAINDLPEFGGGGPDIEPKPNYRPRSVSPFVCDGDAAGASWRQWLADVSRPLAGKSHLLSIGKRAAGYLRPPRQTLVGGEEAGVARYAAFYRSLMREIASTGAVPVPVTFAVAWPGEFTPAQRRIIEASFAVWIRQTPCERGYAMVEQLNDAARELAGELQTPVCEAASLPADAKHFVDACHLTAQGNGWLAVELAKTIAPLVEPLADDESR